MQILHLDLYFDNVLIDKRLNRFDLADFGLAQADEKNFQMNALHEVEKLVTFIDRILFHQQDATKVSLEAKNTLSKAFGEEEISVEEYERVRFKILQDQGYSSVAATQILNFLKTHPTNARDVADFFNIIQSERSGILSVE